MDPESRSRVFLVLLVESMGGPVEDGGWHLYPAWLVALTHVEPKRATCGFTCWAIERSFFAVLLVIQVCHAGTSGRSWDCFGI